MSPALESAPQFSGHAAPVAGAGAAAEGRSIFRKLATVRDAVLGIVTMVLLLAVISAVPVLNLLSLGYFLEATGRVARSGRMRDGWIGLPEFATAGRLFVAIWLWLLPIRFLHSLWIDAELIAPGEEAAERLEVLLVAATLLIGAHLVWAVVRGGKWHHFIWPAPLRFLRWLCFGERSDLAARARTAWQGMKLGHFFRLGVLGFAGAAIWLVIPVLILMGASRISQPGLSALVSMVGGLILGFSALQIPLLQSRFALTGRFRGFFHPGEARRMFARAPLVFWLALSVSLLFALPLYLLKIELTPDEVAWFPNLVFVLLIFPGRILLGWCLARASARETPRFWASRWLARLGLIPVAAAYVFVVWITQYLSWHGSLGLLEQHAFLVPAPLLGL